MNKTFFLKCLDVSVTEGLLEHLFLLGCRRLEGLSVKVCNGGIPACTLGLYFRHITSAVGWWVSWEQAQELGRGKG